MNIKKIIACAILTFAILGMSSCAYIKNSAKTTASERLRKYTDEGIAKLLANGTKIGLPSDVEKILPMLKKFGLKTSATNLSDEIAKLSDKIVKTAEPVLFLAIDEMSLGDAIGLLTSSKQNAPMTNYLQSKTESTVINIFQTEIDKRFKKSETIKILMDTMSAYSVISGKKNLTNISEYSAQLLTKKMCEFIASAEKSDNTNALRIGDLR